jgi:hypothetical protein
MPGFFRIELYVDRIAARRLLAIAGAKSAHTAWSSALENWRRTQELVAQSRLVLGQSDRLLQWFDTFGPRVESENQSGN